MKNFLQKIKKIVSEPHLLNCETKHLFLLSHMRSRSSVLSHIFGSNDDIVGYGELHRSYLTQKDLYTLRFQLKNGRTQVCNKYLYDKLLHSERMIAEELRHLPNMKFIFMIRSPDDTMKSILNMGQKMGNLQYQSEEWVEEYYINRLTALTEYAKTLKDQYLLIESDALVEESDRSLRELSDWLNLKSPLTKEYKTFDKTGVSGHGDPLNNIKEGVLKKTEPHAISLNEHRLEKAEAAYRLCYESLASNAAKVIESTHPSHETVALK